MLLAGIILSANVYAGTWDEKSLIDLALSAVWAEIDSKSAPEPTHKTPVRPVFVTIEKKGRVVGCRGGLESRSSTLEKEIIFVARAAAKHDPRYTPLSSKDINDLKVTITIVERTEPLDRIESLTPADGLVLKAGSRTGIVLPWEGKDPHVRLKWAYTKAGIAQGTACRLFRLKAERFRG